MDIGGSELIESLSSTLEERRKELLVLHEAALLLLSSEEQPDESVLVRLSQLVPKGFLRPRLTRARVTLDGIHYGAADFPENSERLSAAFKCAHSSGVLEVALLPQAECEKQLRFLPEEDALLKSLARFIEAACRHSHDVQRVSEAEHRFHALFDNETECVKVLDEDRRVLDINPAGACLLGSDVAGALNGESVDRFIHPDDLAEYVRLHAEAVKGKAVRGRYRICRPDGRVHMLESFNVPLVTEGSENGRSQVLSLTHDITSLLMQESKFRTLLESSPDAMVIVNRHGIIELVNRVTEELFGYSRVELVGKPVEMLLPEHLAKKHIEYRARYTNQPRLRPMGVGKSLKARARDGREFAVEVALSPVETLDEPLVCATVRDLTGIREFEAALKEMADSVSACTGQEFLERLVRFLSSRFGLTVAFIGLLDEKNRAIRTLAAAVDGQPAENFEYPLVGTPCDKVIRENTCVHEDGVQALYPDDAWFKDNDLHAYAGVRLLNESGDVIGIISAAARKPLRNAIGIESFFKLAATRASAEIDRMGKLAALEASEQRYSLAESGTADGLWDIDLNAGKIYYSPRMGELLGMPVATLGENPETLWARVHAADIQALRDARHAHFHDNKPFDVQYRIRHANGCYRWFRSRGKATRNDQGNVIRFTGSLTDISEGKRNQLQLKAENAWLAQFATGGELADLLRVMAGGIADIFEDAAVNIWLLDANDTVTVFPSDSPVRLDSCKVRALLLEMPTTECTLAEGSAAWPCAAGEQNFERVHVIPITLDGVHERVIVALFLPSKREQQDHERDVLQAAARLVRLDLENIRKATELEQQRLLFEDLFRSQPEALVILDKDDRVLDVNPRFHELFQYSLEEVRGKSLNDLIVPLEFAREATQLSEKALRGSDVAHESFRCRKDGTLVPVSILGAPISVKDTPAAYFAIYRDQSSLHEATERLDHQSRHDQLTGLPNRYEFERRLKAAMERSGAGQGSIGVVYFDLDQFKVVNDTVGHARGDELLQELTRRIAGLVRAPNLLARLGGDEFGLLLVNRAQAESEALAQQLRNRISEKPFRLDGRSFSITASFGVVAIPDGAEQDPHEILSLADSACFFAKERGRNRVQAYDTQEVGVVQRREEMDWISRINEALIENRFRLFHQRIAPVSDLVDTSHIEILLRMVDREGNSVPPAAFIPPAERYNLMPRIDRWMLSAVFERMAQFSRAEQRRLLVAVNLSGSTLSDEGLSDFVVSLFRKHEVMPQAICFEITETAAIANFDDAMRFISTMRELGCRIALDDFGSGLSSFRYLKELAPDFLKIDGSFVREIARSKTDYSMVEAINRVGKIIGLTTVAEFVEDQATLEALRDIGVDFAQGYGLHRPEAW